MSRRCEVRMRFCQPPAELARYFTTFYVAEISVADGDRVTDFLHPEWGNLRFHSGDFPDAENHQGMRISGTPFAVTGPSAKSTRFTLGKGRVWGVGLLPLGWAKFVGAPAGPLANVVVDGHVHPAFTRFRDLAANLFGPEPDPEAELARITAYFQSRLAEPVAHEQRIQAIHEALVDPAVATVEELVRRAGTSTRTVERICHWAFGFSPKLLLRRQRFMRSLAHYMLDPSAKWTGAMDWHYHDQAQFVREFREFMGMTPGKYAGQDHPIIGAFVQERARLAGAAVQTLDRPDGERNGQALRD